MDIPSVKTGQQLYMRIYTCRDTVRGTKSLPQLQRHTFRSNMVLVLLIVLASLALALFWTASSAGCQHIIHLSVSVLLCYFCLVFLIVKLAKVP